MQIRGFNKDFPAHGPWEGNNCGEVTIVVDHQTEQSQGPTTKVYIVPANRIVVALISVT
jgi:hypothetical protein